jgi:fructoselysine 6-kinase
MRSFRVAAMGDNCIDRYEQPPLGSAVGGNALNVAVSWARGGLSAEYLGAVGPDADGARIRAALGREGVATDRLRTLSGATAITRIRLTGGGDRVFIEENYGVSAEYMPTEEDFEYLRQLDYVHIANLRDSMEVVRSLRHARVRISCDMGRVAERGAMAGLDVVLLSMPESHSMEAAEDVARDALKAGAMTAIVTNGAAGSVACELDRLVSMPAFPVEVLDTCGAGDAYLAAFVAERLRGGDLKECVRAGSSAAADCCAVIAAWLQPLEHDREAVR